MAWLLWLRFFILMLLVALIASFVWLQLSQDQER